MFYKIRACTHVKVHVECKLGANMSSMSYFNLQLKCTWTSKKPSHMCKVQKMYKCLAYALYWRCIEQNIYNFKHKSLMFETKLSYDYISLLIICNEKWFPFLLLSFQYLQLHLASLILFWLLKHDTDDGGDNWSMLVLTYVNAMMCMMDKDADDDDNIMERPAKCHHFNYDHLQAKAAVEQLPIAISNLQDDEDCSLDASLLCKMWFWLLWTGGDCWTFTVNCWWH